MLPAEVAPEHHQRLVVADRDQRCKGMCRENRFFAVEPIQRQLAAFLYKPSDPVVLEIAVSLELGIEALRVAMELRQRHASVQCLPVDPNPPSPRCEASKSSTRRNVACTTGTITICAMRSIGLTVNSVWPRFQQLTINWPW
jgi:hypothetical protein